MALISCLWQHMWEAGGKAKSSERCLLPGRKLMTNLDSVLKSRAIILLSEVHLVKATVFPVVMCRCESWTIKKAECQRINAFKLCWRRLESPLDCKEIKPVNAKGNQLTIHWKDRCWSWSSNTLATWCEEMAHWKRPWCWKKMRAGKRGGRRWDG